MRTQEEPGETPRGALEVSNADMQALGSFKRSFIGSLKGSCMGSFKGAFIGSFLGPIGKPRVPFCMGL